MGICSKAFDAVLEGTFVPPPECNIPPPECNNFVKKVLQHLITKPKIAVTESQSLPEYTKGWSGLRSNLFFFFIHSLWPLHGWNI